MNDENVKIEEEILEFDDSEITNLLNKISSGQDKLIKHFNPEYTQEEIKAIEKEIQDEEIYKEKMEKVLDIIIEEEKRKLDGNDNTSSILDEIVEIKEYIVQDESEKEARVEQDVLLSTIQEDLTLTNSYLYTINVYLAGFLMIVMGYILTKLLIGFFKPFL